MASPQAAENTGDSILESGHTAQACARPYISLNLAANFQAS